MDSNDTSQASGREDAPPSESEARYRTLFEHAPDAIVVFDADTGRFVDANENACRLFGIERERLLRLGPLNVSPERQPDGTLSADKAAGLIEQALRGDLPAFEWAHLDGDGNVVDCEVRLVRMPPLSKRLVRGSMTDIRERKAAEAALARREREFRTLAENSPDWILRVGRDLRSVYVNPAVAAASGVSAEALLGKRLTESLPDSESIQAWEAALRECFETGAPQGFLREVNVGDGLLTQTSIVPEYGPGGEFETVLSVTRDVTPVRRAAEAEVRLAAIVESADDAIMSADPDGRITSWNRGAERLFGYAAEEVLGKTSAFLFGDGDDSVRQEVRQRVLAGETITNYLRDWRARDGRVVTTSTTFFPLRSAEGVIIGTASIAHDLTEELAAARALAVSEERLRLAFEGARMGAWTVNRKTGALDFSAQAAVIYGRAPGEMPKTMREVLEVFHPDDAGVVFERLRREQVEDAFPREYRIRLPDGSYRWISGIGELVEDTERGTVSGVIMDIHERKLAEDALRESEERFRAVVNSASVGILIFDGTEIIEANPAAGAIFGFDSAKLAEPGFFWSLSDPETAREMLERGQARLRGEEVASSFEIIARHASGRPLYLHLGASLIELSGKKASLVVIVDITERRLAEDALRESEGRFRNLVDNSPDYITRIGPDLRHDFVNRTAEREAGLDPAQVLGKRADELGYPPELGELWVRRHEYVLDTGEPVEFEYSMPDPGRAGAVVYRRARLIPELGPDGKAHHVLSIVTDITPEKLAAQQRRRLDEQMQHAQKMESLGILAGGIAHDFNNLLVAILGNAGLALMELPPESPARQTVEAIETAAQRAADLTRQMLAYSGQGRFVIESLNLSRLVEEMAHLLEVSVSRRARLTCTFAPGLPNIQADATQVRQVVMNLILNASDALGDGEGAISVSTGVIQADRAYLRSAYVDDDLEEGEFVYLEVTDTGSGMDAETQKRIFDPFFTTKFTGRGLGLAAVLGIVRGHGGTIKLASTAGRGTTFTVLFPAIRPTEGSEAPAEARRESEADALAGRRVLVVDDDETVRAVTRRILERSNVEVLHAADGEEGVAVYRQSPPIDVVLLDMTMPRMDGAETFRALRELDPGARVILMSGYTEQDALERFQGQGLAGFIQKPYRPAELLARLAEVLRAPGT